MKAILARLLGALAAALGTQIPEGITGDPGTAIYTGMILGLYALVHWLVERIGGEPGSP